MMDSSGSEVQSHTPVHSAGFSGREIQRRHIVSGSRNCEAAVMEIGGRATVWPLGPQERQLQRQQPPQRQREQQAQKPFRNDSGFSQPGDEMQTFTNLFPALCEYDNLLLAFQKASKGKSKKAYVQRFQENLQDELFKLQWELLTGIYKSAPLSTFTVRDPKTRKISASHFRDRVVHHAICNIIEPIFEARFIHDTFANRKGKGTLATLKRFDAFQRKVSGRSGGGFALKADIRHYFENVDHAVLLEILGRRVKDRQLLGLISLILENHKTETPGKGMPLGNLTSQFFANVYLAELDAFVKHGLKARFYLRYVDDFVILSRSREELEGWKARVGEFLTGNLRLALHPEKTKVIPLAGGVPLVGFRVFRFHRLLKRSNRLRFFRRLERFKGSLQAGQVSPEHVRLSVAGWDGYARMGNTFELRQVVQENVRAMLNGGEPHTLQGP